MLKYFVLNIDICKCSKLHLDESNRLIYMLQTIYQYVGDPYDLGSQLGRIKEAGHLLDHTVRMIRRSLN